MMSPILRIYFNYAFCIGISSYIVTNFQFRETCITRVYALILNIITLVVLPIIFFKSIYGYLPFHLYPKLMEITIYVVYAVNYVAIIYTLVSRKCRDKALIEVQRIVTKLAEVEADICGSVLNVSRSLRNEFYLKFFTTTYLGIVNLLSFYGWLNIFSWQTILAILFFNTAMNILEVATYCYYLGLWRMALGYEFINRQINEIISSSTVTKKNVERLRHLWSLHAKLSQTVLDVNRMYGLQLLAARLYYVTFTVINGYWGMFFTFDKNTSYLWIIYGAFTYFVRTLDFFLLDYMCDMIVKYQSLPKHAVIEGNWFKELSSYIIYTNSCPLSLWACGLFKIDRKQWFEMMCAILSYSVVLMQFHIYLQNKHK